MMGRQMRKICKEFYEEGRKEGREEGRKEASTKALIKLVRSGRITAMEAAEVLGVSVESFGELMTDKV